MSFACHYKRNTPGYKNPFELCVDETSNYLLCADSIVAENLSLSFSGYYLGTPEADKIYNIFYANSTGIFFVTVTDKDNNLVPHAYTKTILSLYSNSGMGDVFLNASGYTNEFGTFSGLFAAPHMDGDGLYTGIAYAKSGSITGALNITSNISKFAPSELNNIQWNNNNLSITLTNPNSISTNIYLLSGTDGVNFNSVGSYNIPDYDSHTFNFTIGNNFYFFQSEYQPVFSNEIINKDIASGGYPPILSGFSFTWDYTTDEYTSQAPFLKIYCYDEDLFKINDVILQYSGANDTSWTDFSQAALSENPAKINIVNLYNNNILDVSFRVSGAYYNAGSPYYSQILQSDIFHLTGITLTAKTANEGCGVNLYWNAPILTDYIVYYSETAGMSNPISLYPAPTSPLFYFHDTTATPNHVFYYQVRYNTISSNIVSGSGILNLKVPVLSLNNKLTDLPSNSFVTSIDFSANLDSNAIFISGYKTETHGNSITEIKNYILGNPPVFSDNNVLYTDSDYTLEYNLAYISGALTGNYGKIFLSVPFIPTDPSNLNITYDGNINLSWDATITDDFSNFLIKRSGPDGDKSFFTNTNTYIDSSIYNGTWTYSIYNAQVSPSDNTFSGMSNPITKSYTIS